MTPPDVVLRVARFFLVQNSKTRKKLSNYHKLYQMSIKYNKRPKMDQGFIKYTQHPPLQDPLKFTQIWILGLKTNNLATLVLRHQLGFILSCVRRCV
jgi:hypothetical protein